jgi:hypothetical protein
MNHPVDAEADFVLFDPAKGVLVLEVKGGGVHLDENTREWTSVDRKGKRHPIKNPLGQARRAKYQILACIKEPKLWPGGRTPRLLMAHGALFPDLVDIRPLGGADRPLEIMGGRRELACLDQWVKGLYQYWAGQDTSWTPLGTQGIAVAEKLFTGKHTVMAPLATAIDREYRRQIELTNRQARILRTLQYRARAAIAGGAGTGKTLIALQHARALAGPGRRTLLVCYNRALGDFLKREVIGTSNLEVMTFHQLCDWRIRCIQAQSGLDLLSEAAQSYPGSDHFDVHLPFALARSAEIDSFRYQAIIVDEGQDFGDEFWLPMEMLLENAEETPFYIFYDPNQAVYRHSESFPIQDPPFLLLENCRNTRPIHKLSYRYYEGEVMDAPDIEGETPVFLPREDLRTQAEAIRKTVTFLLGQERIRPEDIAVLLLDEPKERHYQSLRASGNPVGATWSFECLWEPGAILVDTARRFKGLEAAIVILWGLQDADNPRDRELLYVAFSRARSRLWLVGPQKGADALLSEGFIALI